MEVRSARVSERAALFLAKQLFAKNKSAGAVFQRSMMTVIRNTILDTRIQDLKNGEPTNQTDDWFNSLAQELIDGRHGRQQTYAKTFIVKSDSEKTCAQTAPPATN